MLKGLTILILLPILALPTFYCRADGFSAILNGKSYHLNSNKDWNEKNFGLGIEYEFTQKSAWKKVVMANGFRDSMDEMSYMAGFGLHRRLYETNRLSGFYVYAGLNAFLMTRDDVNSGKPFPGILPSVSIGNQHIGLNLTYLPTQAVEEMTDSELVDPTIDGIVFLQFKISLDQLLP